MDFLKKLSVTALCFLLAVCSVGCGGSGEKAPAPEQASQQSEAVASHEPLSLPEEESEEKPPEEEPLDPALAVLPDLAVFYNREPSKQGKLDGGLRTTFIGIPKDNMDTIVEETLSLLQSERYQLSLQQVRTVPHTKKHDAYRYDFFYTGTNEGVGLLTDSKDGEVTFNAQLRITPLNNDFQVSFVYDSAFSIEEPACLCSFNLAKGGSGSSSGGSSGGGETFIPDAAKLPCLTCGGDKKCNRCNGYGYIWRDDIRSDCTRCQKGKCPACKGTGTR